MPSGRRARLDTLQLFIDALLPYGVGVRFTGEPITDDATLRLKIKAAASRYGRTQDRAQVRTHLREYASANEARP